MEGAGNGNREKVIIKPEIGRCVLSRHGLWGEGAVPRPTSIFRHAAGGIYFYMCRTLVSVDI